MFHNVSSTSGSVRLPAENQNTNQAFLQGTGNSLESMRTQYISLVLLRQQLDKPWTSEETKHSILDLLAHYDLKVHGRTVTAPSPQSPCSPLAEEPALVRAVFGTTVEEQRKILENIQQRNKQRSPCYS